MRMKAVVEEEKLDKNIAGGSWGNGEHYGFDVRLCALSDVNSRIRCVRFVVVDLER